MDFEAVWHEHKPFIISVGAGVLVFLMGLYWQWAVMAEGEKLSVQAQNLELTKDELLGEVEAGWSQEMGVEQAFSEEAGNRIVGVVAFKHRPEYVSIGEEDPAIAYRSRLQSLKELTKDADKRDIRYPNRLGFRQEISPAEVPKTLLQMDVAERIFDRLIVEEVAEVDQFKAAEPRHHLLPGGERVLRAIPVHLTIETTYPDLLRFLGHFQTKPGDFLAVDKLDVTRKSSKGGQSRPSSSLLLEASMTLTALTIVPRDEIEAEVEESTETGTSTGRTRRRRRRRGRQR